MTCRLCSACGHGSLRVPDGGAEDYTQKYNADFALEMNRSAAEYLEKFLARTKAQGEH